MPVPHPWSRELALGGVLCLLLWVAPASLSAQGRLRGVVLDTAGVPLPNVDVGVLALHKLVRTDEKGRFVLDRLPVGELELSVRRLGYQPQRVVVVIRGTTPDSIRATLSMLPIAGVNVTESMERRREGIEQFHRRRTRGIGTFVTRDDIIARNSFAPSDMLRNVPGIRLVRTRAGRGVRFSSAYGRRGDCAPMLWIDGQRAQAMELDDIALSDIEGIELYNGPSTTPVEFSRSASELSCGTIVVWSRPPNVRTP